MSNEARELIRRVQAAIATVPRQHLYQHFSIETSVLRQIDQICTMTETALDEQDEEMARALGGSD